jgi:uncharacterized membrane-anchored protein YjiN (DUF445 family)
MQAPLENGKHAAPEMRDPASPPLPGKSAEDRLIALRRTKFVATATLACCILVFILARLFQPRLPLLGYVAAFAEAAAIGGLADWYAVVALFRRPLGLPIPHTAIIPENQARIADNLGRFIEANFLAPGPVREKLKEVDFAALVADWLSEPRRAGDLSHFIARLAPRMLSALEESGLRDFVTERLLDQLRQVRVAPFAAELLTAFMADRRHQRLFDEIIGMLARLLSDEEALAAMRERIRRELPTLFNLFRADAYLLKRIVAAAAALLEEARTDEHHPLREEFDLFVAGFIDQLRHSPDYAERAEALKQDLLQRPEFRALAGEMWKGLAAFVAHDAGRKGSRIRRHLADMLVEVGRHLADDPRIRADMNHGFVVALAAFVESQKSGVSSFIAGQMKRWDLSQLVRLIEINVGRDLQYIRFNGMLIGGLAGLALHAAERLLIGD